MGNLVIPYGESLSGSGPHALAFVNTFLLGISEIVGCCRIMVTKGDASSFENRCAPREMYVPDGCVDFLSGGVVRDSLLQSLRH